MDIKIKYVLIAQLKLDEVIINSDNSHLQIVVVSEMFNGISWIKQQQVIYALLIEFITDNQIRVLSIKAYTSAECISNYKLNGF